MSISKEKHTIFKIVMSNFKIMSKKHTILKNVMFFEVMSNIWKSYVFLGFSNEKTYDS